MKQNRSLKYWPIPVYISPFKMVLAWTETISSWDIGLGIVSVHITKVLLSGPFQLKLHKMKKNGAGGTSCRENNKKGKRRNTHTQRERQYRYLELCRCYLQGRNTRCRLLLMLPSSPVPLLFRLLLPFLLSFPLLFFLSPLFCIDPRGQWEYRMPHLLRLSICCFISIYALGKLDYWRQLIL